MTVNPEHTPVEDYSALLFKANGTALTVSIVAISNIIPTQDFSFPIWPSAIYFAGLILAFGVHWLTVAQNTDIRRRQQRAYVASILAEKSEQAEQHDVLKLQIEKISSELDRQEKHMFTVEQVVRLQARSSMFYWASAFCFLIGTGLALWFLNMAI